jgi:S-formylglutathione hydrolase FrmB
VVVPQGARAGDSDPEWVDRGHGRDWSTTITEELIGAVDSRYHAIADRSGRAIIGISAGGCGATIIAAQHPQLYSVVQSWSGYFHATNPRARSRVTSVAQGERAEADLHTYVRDGWRTYDRWPIAFGFYIGASDAHFLPENEQLHRELLEAGIQHTYAVYQASLLSHLRTAV